MLGYSVVKEGSYEADGVSTRPMDDPHEAPNYKETR